MEPQKNRMFGLVALSRYFFKCPPRKHMIFIMIVAAVLFPIAGSDIFTKTRFFIFLIAPAIVAAVLSPYAIRNLGGALKESHSFFISTISMFGIAALLAVCTLIEKFYVFKIWNTLEILLLGLAAIFMLHLLVFAAVGGISIYRAALPALLYLSLSAIILHSFGIVTAKMLAHFSLLVLVSFALALAFIKLTDAPFQRTLGISTFDLISLAIQEYVDPASASINPFKNVGKKVIVPFQAVKFDTGKSSSIISVPWLHPGPIESIGGKLPSLISAHLRKFFAECVFAHTYVDHTLNPTTLEDIAGKICRIAAAKKFYKEASAKATKFIEINVRKVSIIAQKIGHFYIFISSFAPRTTEDITPAIGFALLKDFKNKAVFIDAHNAFSIDEDTEPVSFLDPRAGDLSAAINSAKQKLDSEKQAQFKVSFLSSQKDFSEYGVRGISAIVFEVQKQKTAIVMLDANNLTSEFRNRLRAKIKARGIDIAEIATTDAHLGDLVIKKYSMEGVSGAAEMEDEIASLVKKAAEQAETAKAHYLFSSLETRVFGEKTFHQLIATAHSLIPFAKFLVTSGLIAFLLAAYVVLQVV